MDRIIKFRAWDEGNKIMHHNFQWFDSTKGGVDKEGTSWICFISDKEDADRSKIMVLYLIILISSNSLKRCNLLDVLTKTG